jgi:hypothetical protein
MKRFIIILLSLFFMTYFSYSQVKWELAKDIHGFNNLNIEAFTKDTFVISSYYNTLRNGNITFEWALQLTKDRGNTWEYIYQDSTSVADIPRQPLRIDALEVTENSVIAFTREDGFLFVSKDYGNTWDSLLIFEPFGRGSRLDSYKNKIVIYTYDNYIITYNTDTGDTTHIDIPKFDLKNEDAKLLMVEQLHIKDANFLYLVYTDITKDSSYSYLYLTKDRGKTWTLSRNNHYYKDMIFLSDSVVYGCGSTSPTESGKGDFSGVIDKSTNGGKTWKTLINGANADTAVFISYFLDFYTNNDLIICTPQTYNSISAKVGEDIWQFDNIKPTDFRNSGWMNDVAIDKEGNIMATFESHYIVRNVNPPSTVVETISDKSFNYSKLYIYNISGQIVSESRKGSSINTLELPDGAYFLIYIDDNYNVLKTDKLIITH